MPERKNTEDKVIVNLWELNSVGVIIPYNSNILYSNQVGGHANYHPQLEGVFIPLSSAEDGPCPLSEELYYYFTGDKWKGWCSEKIDEETADALDEFFRKYKRFKDYNIRVDREKLDASVESWIHVKFDIPQNRFPLFTGIRTKEAVLTWPNSD